MTDSVGNRSKYPHFVHGMQGGVPVTPLNGSDESSVPIEYPVFPIRGPIGAVGMMVDASRVKPRHVIGRRKGGAAQAA